MFTLDLLLFFVLIASFVFIPDTFAFFGFASLKIAQAALELKLRPLIACLDHDPRDLKSVQSAWTVVPPDQSGPLNF